MKKTLLKPSIELCGVALLFIAVGCNSPAGMAVQLVGKAVDDVNTSNYSKELMGQPPSAADAKFGGPIDVWNEVGGPRSWRIYPVSMDVMGNQRYVVVVRGNRIRGVTKVAIDASGVDLARKVMLDQKVQGKTPSECQAALDMGPPLVTARSTNTGQMAQLYNAQMIQGIGSKQYARLLYDSSGRCSEVKLIDVSASSGDAPPQ